jgi:L-threonylcarbamoyladenylate synthase
MPALPPSPQFLLPTRPETYARSLYARLRELDRFAFDRLLVEAPPTDEAWWAINDRLVRAAVGSAGKVRR